MNIREGARRMKLAGKWMVVVPLCIMILVMGIVGIMIAARPGAASLVYLGPAFAVALFYLEIPGWALLLFGWIVEGFATKEEM
jgi:hypothetical protein